MVGKNLLICNSFFNACKMESFIGQCIVTHLHTKYINKALTSMLQVGFDVVVIHYAEIVCVALLLISMHFSETKWPQNKQH